MLLCTEKDRLVIVFNVGWTKQWQRGTAIKIPGTELSASKIASLLLENGAQPVPYSVRFFLRFFRRLTQRKHAVVALYRNRNLDPNPCSRYERDPNIQMPADKFVQPRVWCITETI